MKSADAIIINVPRGAFSIHCFECVGQQTTNEWSFRSSEYPFRDSSGAGGGYVEQSRSNRPADLLLLLFLRWLAAGGNWDDNCGWGS